MSTPKAESGPSNESATATPSTQTRQAYQHRPWKEPPEASQIAKEACALVNIKITKKSWLQYPSRFSAPPPGLSFKELCSNYPNHLDGKLLVEMSAAGLKPRDIVEMMPSDTRNPGLGTEWSWVTERMKKAKLARDNRQGATSQSTLVEVEESSQPTSQTISVKGEGPSQPASRATTAVTLAKAVRKTASPTAEHLPISDSSILSAPTQLGSKTTPQTRRANSSSSVLPLAAPTQLLWPVPKTTMTQNHWPGATATAGVVPAVMPTPFDRTITARTMITEGNQFSFRQSPPNTTPASHNTREYRHKEMLREEIRKQLKLLVDISSTAEGFISRSQQQQQNDILLQWKKWCDEHSLTMARRYGVFVGPTLTGFVIKDSLTRLLGTLTKIYMRQDGSGRAMIEERARSQALEYAEALLNQYTWDLQLRADQLFPPIAPPAASFPMATPDTTNDINAPGDRYGYYGVQLSSAALSFTQQFTKKAAEGTTDEQSSHPADTSPPGPSSAALQEHQQTSVPQASHACFSCQNLKKRCDKVLPACGTCLRSYKDCNYASHYDA
jgi:hypothetical protein